MDAETIFTGVAAYTALIAAGIAIWQALSASKAAAWAQLFHARTESKARRVAEAYAALMRFCRCVEEWVFAASLVGYHRNNPEEDPDRHEDAARNKIRYYQDMYTAWLEYLPAFDIMPSFNERCFDVIQEVTKGRDVPNEETPHHIERVLALTADLQEDLIHWVFYSLPTELGLEEEDDGNATERVPRSA